MKTFHARHILVKHRHEAEDLLKKLAEGKEFSELARKYSICSSATNGGDLGKIQFGKADADFEEAVINLAVEQVSTKPVRTKFGFHIIKRIA